MKKVNVDVEELDNLLTAALDELYEVRERTASAIKLFSHIKQTWITKQELKAQA